MNVIEVKNLTKTYGKTLAVDKISFEVKKGEIFGLLGPNGAGKTTTLEILEGAKAADSGGGSVKILGLRAATHRGEISRKMGIVLQTTGFFPELSLLELLNLFASFYEDHADLTSLIEKFDLQKILHHKYPELSGGQRQRFVLAMALIPNPELLILDEPTVALDPAVRQKFWEIIMNLQKEGLTMLLTTHYMEEAEIVCDRVAIIDRGRIVAEGAPVKLINSLGIVSRVKFMSSKSINLHDLEILPGILSVRRDRYTYELETETPEVSLRELLTWEKQFSGKIFSLQVQQATLGDVFLKLTGHHLRD